MMEFIKTLWRKFTSIENKVAIAGLLIALFSSLAASTQAFIILSDRDSDFKKSTYDRQFDISFELSENSYDLLLALKSIADILGDKYENEINDQIKSEVIRLNKENFFDALKTYTRQLHKGMLILPAGLYEDCQVVGETYSEVFDLLYEGELNEEELLGLFEEGKEGHNILIASMRDYFGVDKLSEEIPSIISPKVNL